MPPPSLPARAFWAAEVDLPLGSGSGIPKLNELSGEEALGAGVSSLPSPAPTSTWLVQGTGEAGGRTASAAEAPGTAKGRDECRCVRHRC